MYDIKWIRENPEAFDSGLKRRGLEPLSAKLLALDETRRALITKLEQAQARRNAASKEIGQAKAKKDEATAQKLLAEVAAFKTDMPAMEAQEKEASAALEKELAQIPNMPLADVPDGKDEHDNVEHHTHGKKRDYAFTPKQHFELGEALGQMDFELAAKLSGARFVVLQKGLARMERALGQLFLDMHGDEHGYTEVNPPILVRDDVMFGTAQLPKFAEDQFEALTGVDALMKRIDSIGSAEVVQYARELGGNRLWLIPTAEVPLTNLVRESIVAEDELPLRFTACTPCFRAEAGAAGKDTRGMIRQHQFTKVELVSITTPEQSRRRARAHAGLRRGRAEEARPALPRGDAVHRRHGLRGAKDLRHRGLAAGPEHVPRDLLLLGLRRVPGPAHEGALQGQGRQGEGPCAHAQRLRRRRRPRADRGDGDLSAGRWIDRGARRVEAVYGRADKGRTGVMRILITNDDGIHAEGLDACETIARTLSDEIWVVAPETDQSGVAHSLSLNDPLRLREVGDRRFAVKGTPTDCVIMGLRYIMQEPPDLVLSGVNRGRNCAEDVTYSGTVAGAMEGTVLGVPSFALSQSYSFANRTDPPWETAIQFAPDLIRRVLETGMPRDVLVNVNFPDCKPEEVAGIAVTCQGKRDQELLRIEPRQDGRGNPYYWIAFARGGIRGAAHGSDLAAIAANRIAVTPLKLDLTDEPFMTQLAELFD